MSRYLFRFGCLLVCLLVCLLLPVSAWSGGWLLRNVNVINLENGEICTAQDLFIQDGLIHAQGPSGQLTALVESVDRVIEGGGGWLIPGLSEMHAHVPAGNRGDAYTQDVLDLFLANGVTTIRGMLGNASHLALRESLAEHQIRGPRLITSGPSFNGESVTGTEQGMARVREQAEAGYDFLKIHPGLSRMEFLAIAQTAHEVGIPFAGHVSFETGLMTALEQKQATIDHLDSYAEAMIPEGAALAGVAPQFFGLNLATGMESAMAPALAEATAAAGVWQVPTQSLFETTTGSEAIDDLLARPGMDMIGDQLRDSWVNAVQDIRNRLDPQDRRRFLAARRALLTAMQNAGAGLLLGSDAPQIMNVPGYSIHQELVYLVEAGLTPLEALQTGTVNVARFLDRPDEGVIAPGFRADFVLLRANPLEDITATTQINGVAQDGQWYNRATLDGWLSRVRSNGL